MLDRTIAPPIQDAVSFDYHLQACNTETGHNGVPIYWLSAGTQDVVQVEWVFDAGLWEEQKPGVARATGALLKNGTTQKNALQINEALEFYGASLTATVTNDYTFVTLHALSKHLEVLLPIVREVLFQPSFPEKELDIYIRNTLQRLSIKLQKTDFVAHREIDAYLFGQQHPYGKFILPEDFQALTSEDLKNFHKQYYASRNCKIFLAGKIDQSHVRLVEEYFGREKWGVEAPRISLDYLLTPDAEKKHRLQITEKSVQGSIRLNRLFPKRNHPDFAPMVLLNTVFGGYFGSRLMANIREDKGYTYGIYSHIYSYKNNSAFMIATEAGAEVCEAAISEIYKEMDLLCREKIPEAELSLVKNYLLGNILGGLDGPFSLIQRWKSIILNGLPAQQFDKNIEIYKNVTAEELLILAQKYLLKEDYFELVVS
jgi:predicted Zn-dependent peptidase